MRGGSDDPPTLTSCWREEGARRWGNPEAVASQVLLTGSRWGKVGYRLTDPLRAGRTQFLEQQGADRVKGSEGDYVEIGQLRQAGIVSENFVEKKGAEIVYENFAETRMLMLR